ncbi:MAG: hypothetical protein NZ954_05200 [Thermofilaceae archaeon]|nr:hypothetical protein [Thermofilaceae archaeon]MCX8180203.1 hypothetical protein [Thermofilaceae archaeon]MDW8004141.1 hypothetical protein [Thermofilaceae archaeon]
MMSIRDRKAGIVIFDTSAILCCVAEGIDLANAARDAVEAETRLIVPTAVVRELESLAQGRGRKGKLARVALQELRRLVGTSELELIDAGGMDVDELLIKLAKSLDGFIVTADEWVRKKARDLGVPVIVYVSSKKRFQRV